MKIQGLSVMMLMAISVGAGGGCTADAVPLPDTVEEARKAQTACAADMKLPVSITNSVGIAFCLIPAGSFMMGSDTGQSDAPVHRVTIARPFYMGVCEVTRKQWEMVTRLKRSDFFPGEEMPINHITYREAQRFITALNKLENRTAANGYCLPTEAEWELAARAGEGFNPAAFAGQGWTRENSGLTLHQVGTKAPNAFGLFDLHGNVWEWCADYYHPQAYHFSTATNPVVQQQSLWGYRVLRGGSAFHDLPTASSGNRAYSQESRAERYIGFRIVCPAVPAQANDAAQEDETTKADDEEGAQ